MTRRKSGFVATSITMAATLDTIENASNNMVNVMGQLTLYPWTETTSRLVDQVLHVQELVADLRRVAESDQPALPANVVPGPWGRTA